MTVTLFCVAHQETFVTLALDGGAAPPRHISTAATDASPSGARLPSLDFVRGAVMVLMAIAIIVGHNAVARVLYAVESPSWFLRFLYVGGSVTIPGLGWQVAILYVLFPWVGVMAAGYGFGALMRTTPERRRRTLFAIGGAATMLFILLRTAGVYGDPRPWEPTQSVLGFLNTAKYPASLLFLLMTLGPTIAILPLLERATGRVARWLQTFGRVPFFYYVLHIPLIHAVAVLIALVRTPSDVGWLVANHPMLPPPPPPGYIWSLPLLYAVAVGAVVLLYVP